MRTIAFFGALSFLVPLSVLAGTFGEGYSSATPGGPAAIYFRAFTIHTEREACAKSANPVELRVYPNPLLLKIGDRIHRSNVDTRPSELVVEAYGENGEFLPALPIAVSTMDLQNVTTSRSDWDYLEAVREGEDELVVAWACAGRNGVPIVTRVRIIVRPGDEISN